MTLFHIEKQDRLVEDSMDKEIDFWHRAMQASDDYNEWDGIVTDADGYDITPSKRSTIVEMTPEERRKDQEEFRDCPEDHEEDDLPY